MAIYEVEGPDGAIYEVEGPEGAKDEDIIKAVQAQIGGGQASPPPEPKSSEQIQSDLNTMMEQGAPGEEIVKYIESTGRPLEPKDRGWLLGEYEESRASGNPARRPFNVAPQPDEREEIGDSEAAWLGLQSGALRGFDDEWKGFWGATGNKIGNFLGMNESTAGFWDIYDIIQQQELDRKEQAWEESPFAYSAGFLPGALTGPSFARAGKENTARSYAQAGAAEGAISAAGNTDGNIAERALAAGGGAVAGGVLGAASKPVVDVVGAVGSRVAERVRPTGNNLNSGLDALALRADLDTDAMAARAQELRDVGIEPRLVDIVDEQGRGVISAAANRQTPASEDLARAADEVYAAMPERVAEQARSRIAPDSPRANQIAEATDELRGSTFSARVDDVRDQPVPMTDDIVAILGTREGAAALKTAQGYMDNPADKEAVDRVLAAIRSANRDIPKDMPPAVQEQVRRQIFQDANITVDIADKFARAMRDRGGQNRGLQRVATNFANRVRDAARSASDDYSRALDDYADASRTIEAAEGTGAFDRSNFLGTGGSTPDRFANAVDAAGPATGRPQFVDELGEQTEGVSPLEALRARAADAVDDVALEGSGNRAAAVARQFARGPNQQRRSEALIGPEAAQDLRTAMQGELSRLENTRYIDPRVGSDTFRRQQQEGGVSDEIIETAATAGFSPMFTAIRTAGRWLRNRGIRDADAERLVRDAIDPARTNDALAYLVQRGVPKNEAQAFVRALARGVTDGRMPGRLGGEMVGNERPTNPGSVRVLHRARRVEPGPAARFNLDDIER